MNRKQLLFHVQNHRLRESGKGLPAKRLRAQLHESDAAFHESYPDDDRLDDLPWKRLRAAAASSKVVQAGTSDKPAMQLLRLIRTVLVRQKQYESLDVQYKDCSNKLY